MTYMVGKPCLRIYRIDERLGGLVLPLQVVAVVDHVPPMLADETEPPPTADRREAPVYLREHVRWEAIAVH